MKAYLGTKKSLTVYPSQTPEARSAYYQENKERIRQTQKAWREANAEYLSEYNKNYRKQNAEAISAQRKTHNLGKKTDDGYVYVFQAGTDPEYKIGYTGRQVSRRRAEAQKDNARELTVVYESGFFKNARQAEQELHETFAGKKIRGEWFTLNKTNLKDIKTLVNKKISGKK